MKRARHSRGRRTRSAEVSASGIVHALVLALTFLMAVPLVSIADEVLELEIPVVTPELVFQDPQLQKMWALDAIAPFEDKAPLWSMLDPEFQQAVEAEIEKLGLDGSDS